MADERDATPEERQKLIDLLQAGKVKLTPVGERAFERGIVKKDHDFTVVEVEIRNLWESTDEKGDNLGGICIGWGTVSAGFGELTIMFAKDGKIKADTEGMGKKFCKEVLAKLVDSWEDDTGGKE